MTQTHDVRAERAHRDPPVRVVSGLGVAALVVGVLAAMFVCFTGAFLGAGGAGGRELLLAFGGAAAVAGLVSLILFIAVRQG